MSPSKSHPSPPGLQPSSPLQGLHLRSPSTNAGSSRTTFMVRGTGAHTRSSGLPTWIPIAKVTTQGDMCRLAKGLHRNLPQFLQGTLEMSSAGGTTR
jgi:hypothetical protein